MPQYYAEEEDDQIDIRFRRGRVSPARPVRYAADPRAAERLERLERMDRAAYYQAATGGLFLPNRSGALGGRRQSRSHSRHASLPAAAPVIINNHIDNYYEDEAILDDEPRYHYPSQQIIPVPVRQMHHSHSRRRHSRGHSRHGSPQSRSSSSSFSSQHSRMIKEQQQHHQQHELEETRRKLEKFEMAQKKEAEERVMKEELELRRLKEMEKKEKEAKAMKVAEDKAIEAWKKKEEMRKEAEKKAKEEEEKAIEEWKKKEEKRKEAEKKAKEEEDRRYKERIEDDMRKAGMSENQIASVLKKERPGHELMAPPERPTYTRMARRHISIETLRTHHIDFELDIDPGFVIIKRWVPEYEQDFLWDHTRQIREGRHHHHRQLAIPAPPVQVVIEENARPRREEDRLEFVRKKRRPSPSPLLTFFAGGRR